MENICSSEGIHWMKESSLKCLTGVPVASIVLAVQLLKDILAKKRREAHTDIPLPNDGKGCTQIQFNSAFVVIASLTLSLIHI